MFAFIGENVAPGLAPGVLAQIMSGIPRREGLDATFRISIIEEPRGSCLVCS